MDLTLKNVGEGEKSSQMYFASTYERISGARGQVVSCGFPTAQVLISLIFALII